MIPSSFSKHDAMKECTFDVARTGGGYVIVVIIKEYGRKRASISAWMKLLVADRMF